MTHRTKKHSSEETGKMGELGGRRGGQRPIRAKFAIPHAASVEAVEGEIDALRMWVGHHGW